MQFNTPPVLKPGAAAVAALLIYGALGAWHACRTWSFEALLLPGLVATGMLAVCFFAMAGGVFPRLKRKEPPKKKRLYRILLCAGFLLFIAAGVALDMAWEARVESALPERMPPPPYLSETSDREERAVWVRNYEKAWSEARREWKAEVRSLSRPVRSAAWLTCSLFLVVTQFFRPGPQAPDTRPARAGTNR